MGITQNKTLLVIGVVLLLVVFAFSYKAYSVNLQKEKELVIIEAQRQKEESILRQKNEAVEVERAAKNAALQSCLSDVAKKNQQSLANFLAALKQVYGSDDVMTVCNRYTTYDARIKCDDNLTANMNKIIDEKKEGDAECYRRFPQD